MMGIARSGSVYCTVAVTLERFYATTKPFASNGWIKKGLMPIIFLCSICYNIPKFFELKTHTSIFTNETMIVATSLRRNPIYISVYLTWMKIIIMEIIPYVTILTLNICIMKQVYQGSKFRSSFKDTRGKTEVEKRASSRPWNFSSFRKSTVVVSNLLTLQIPVQFRTAPLR